MRLSLLLGLALLVIGSAGEPRVIPIAPAEQAARGSAEKAPAGRIVVFLWHDSPNDLETLAGLRRGLEVMGHAVAREIHAGQDEERARRELLAARDEGLDLLVALGTRSAGIAIEVLPDRPIVFSAVTNPVISGIVPSWQGGRERVAGNSNWFDRGRMLDVFRQAVPGLRRLAIVRSPGNAVSAAELEEARRALPERPDLEIVELVVPEAGDLGAVLDRSLAEVDAVWLPIDFDLYQPVPLALLVARAKAARKPVVASISRAAGAGALVTLTVDYRQLGLKASSIVRRVLEGEEPRTIEIGRMSSTRLHVDLGAARAIGLELPIDLLLDAHEIAGREEAR